MDFKGKFRTLESRRGMPLTVIDDHSRFNIMQALDMATPVTSYRPSPRARRRWASPTASTFFTNRV